MASLIESLIGNAVQRPDENRIAPVRRPLPERPRDLLDIFSAMGGEATLANLARSMDLKPATPRWLTAVVLDRWPSVAELKAQPEPYDARRHLAELIQSVEFRSLLAQRILTAYPEKRRMLFVRVPQCAGSRFVQLVQTMHPLFPDRIATRRAAPPRDFFPVLGQHMGQYLHTRTVMLIQARMAAFFRPQPEVQAAAEREPSVEEALPWAAAAPPYRAIDRLFTIVRDPEDIILGQVNGIATRVLKHSDDDDAPGMRLWRKRLQPAFASTGSVDPKAIARRVLALFPHADPICHALGDGTLAGARENCAVTNVEIADLSRFDEWILRTWDTKPEAAPPALPEVLGRSDLTAEDTARLAKLTEQDRPFYARIKALIDSAELSSIAGSQL